VTTAADAAIFLAARTGGLAMVAMDEDLLPKKKPTHEIGQDLSLLSLAELAERISLLKDEIDRLEAAVRSKSATRQAADQFFKR